MLKTKKRKKYEKKAKMSSISSSSSVFTWKFNKKSKEIIIIIEIINILCLIQKRTILHRSHYTRIEFRKNSESKFTIFSAKEMEKKRKKIGENDENRSVKLFK